MRKMCKRTLGVYLTLLMLIMTACGRYEDAVPKASQGYGADVQDGESEASQGHETDVQDGETEAPQGYEADVQNGETEAPQGYEADVQNGETEASQGYEADTQDRETDYSREDIPPAPQEDVSESSESDVTANLPAYGSYYYDLINVVLYLELYDELPLNYITKSEARKLGWEGGSVEKYREGAVIGGDSFGNREGLLPQADGRSYTECDIDTDGYESRGSRRLVFSNDGLYFYTSDHYDKFSEVKVT